MRTVKRLLRSGDTWLVVHDGEHEDGGEPAARWQPGPGRLTATAPLQSFMAHCHASEPWEAVGPGDPSVPSGLREAIGAGPLP